MCHIDNLKSVLEKGILSHNRVVSEDIQPSMISNRDIVENRKKVIVNAKSLWDYANVYLG